jgi:hypothetical protein
MRPELRFSAKESVPEKVVLESGRNVTRNDTLRPVASVSGKEGPVSMNSVKLLEALRRVILCPPLFVRVTVPGELSVFTVTDPKFSDDGLAAIPALAGAAKRLQVVSTTTKSRHTNALLIIFILSFPLGAKNSTEPGLVGGSAGIDAQLLKLLKETIYEELFCPLLAASSDLVQVVTTIY